MYELHTLSYNCPLLITSKNMITPILLMTTSKYGVSPTETLNQVNMSLQSLKCINSIGVSHFLTILTAFYWRVW
jgi:hypothetical protein